MEACERWAEAADQTEIAGDRAVAAGSGLAGIASNQVAGASLALPFLDLKMALSVASALGQNVACWTTDHQRRSVLKQVFDRKSFEDSVPRQIADRTLAAHLQSEIHALRLVVHDNPTYGPSKVPADPSNVVHVPGTDLERKTSAQGEVFARREYASYKKTAS